MTDTDEAGATVLVVDDDEDLADTCAIWLGSEYDVRVAYDGDEALEEVDDEVDVVLLDRRMPGMSGDEVLNRIRERDIDCRIAMLTAVEPDTDIIEMPFDEYLVKPVRRDDILDAIEELISRAEYDDELQEYFAVTAKIGALEAQFPEEELRADERVKALRERASELEEQINERMSDLDFDTAFREIDDA